MSLGKVSFRVCLYADLAFGRECGLDPGGRHVGKIGVMVSWVISSLALAANFGKVLFVQLECFEINHPGLHVAYGIATILVLLHMVSSRVQ